MLPTCRQVLEVNQRLPIQLPPVIRIQCTQAQPHTAEDRALAAALVHLESTHALAVHPGSFDARLPCMQPVPLLLSGELLHVGAGKTQAD